MRGVALCIVGGLILGGCSTSSLDAALQPPPKIANLELDSVPSGADATTSIGPGCKTPCSLPIAAAETFTVTFRLDKFQPLTLPVQVVQAATEDGSLPAISFEPNVLIADLMPTGGGRKSSRKASRRNRPSTSRSAASPAVSAPAAER